MAKRLRERTSTKPRLRVGAALFKELAEAYSADRIAENGKRPVLTVALDGALYTVTGRRHSGQIGNVERIEARRLYQLAEWPFPRIKPLTYDQRSSTNVRGEKFYTGVKVRFGGKDYVLGPERINVYQAKTRESRRAPADVAPRTGKPKTYAWTPELDQQLRNSWTTPSRGAIATIAKSLGFPFHVVKQRAVILNLLPMKHEKRVAAQIAKQAEATPPASERQAVEDPIDAAKRLRHAICPNRPSCYTRAMWDPTDTAEVLAAQGFRYGFDPDPVTGFPVCANCRTTMVAAEPVAVPEAFAQAATAAGSHQPRLWPDPPFNFQGAWMQLEAKEDEITSLQSEFDELSKRTRRTAKDLAKANKERTVMIAELRKRRLQKAREDLNRRDHREEQLQPITGCAFEANTGKPCPVCRAESPSMVAAALQATNGALTDISSEAHRTLAITANSRTIDLAEKIHDAELVADALTARGLLGIPVEVVETWDEAQRREALAWVDGGMDRFVVPEILGLPHVAAAAGEEEQSCIECGARLLRLKEGDGRPYAVGAFVGQFCPGLETQERNTASAHVGQA